MTNTAAIPKLIVKPIKSNTVLALADQLVVSGTRFATVWILARFCGSEQLGLYSLGFTLFVVVDLIQQAFVSSPFNVLLQSYPQDQRPRYAAAATVQAATVAVLGAVALSLVGLSCFVFGKPNLGSVLLAVAASGGIAIMREFVRRQCFAESHFAKALTLDLCVSTIQIGLMLALLQAGNLSAFTAHLCVGIACLAFIAACMRAANLHSLPERSMWRESLSKHWTFGRWACLSQVANQLGWTLTQWIIAFGLSTEATGRFSGCLTLVFLSNPFILGLSNMLLPRLAETIANEGIDESLRLATRACGITAGAMLLFSLIVALYGERISVFIYADPAYEGTSIVHFGLCAAVSVLSITMPLDALMWASQRPELSAISSLIGMLVSVLAVLLCVRWGIAGAAIGLLIGSGVEAATRIFCIRWKYVQRIPRGVLKEV
ncbi:MAG: lipopolysaccharide biosynthesis protein [Aureliella sp.]